MNGIGSDVWRELWEAARNYSTWVAYKEIEYPNISDGSRCVLCHQTLSEEAKERLVSFENFVKGEMEKAALDAAKEYDAVTQAIEVLPSLSILNARIDASGLPHEIADRAMNFFVKLQEGNDLLFKIESEEDIPDFSILPKWGEEAKLQSENLEEMAKKYEEDAKTKNREELNKRVSGLQTKKWLFENRSAIEKEVDRLKLVKQLQEAKKLTNTRALSQKRGIWRKR